MPLQVDIGKAYTAPYHTHTTPSRRSLPQRVYGAVRHGYLQRRYGYARGVGPQWYRFLSLLAWFYPAAEAEFGSWAMYLLPPSAGARLLDVGCGSGESLRRITSMGWEAEGVDVDPLAVENARAKGVRVRLGDLASQQYPDDYFDAVYMSHVIEHVHDPAGLLRECRRVLKPGGRLVALTPNVDSWGHARFGRAWVSLDPPRHLMLFRPQTLAKLVEDAHLSVVQLTTMVRDATGVWLLSGEIRRGGPVWYGSRRGIRRWLTALSFQVAEQMILRIKPHIGEELLLMATKHSG
jgi:SAM-dependent methyltransferase